MTDSLLTAIVEALLFAADEPVGTERLASLLVEYEADDVQQSVDELIQRYQEAAGTAFYLAEVGNGYQFRTREKYAPWVKRMFARERLRRLTPAALETLACVAYRQPATRSEVEEIRGVDCSGTLKGLIERGLVRLAGRRSTAGKPMTYATTQGFLNLFGLATIKDLPSLDELGADLDYDSQLSLLDQSDESDGDTT